jgi:hypothetical protein
LLRTGAIVTPCRFFNALIKSFAVYGLQAINWKELIGKFVHSFEFKENNV